ncbi:MAG: T9SS type A sorting domain-containing protein [Bacteroidetes bacterium]|nr:T9SS type A sorting domain-containing protein [Bacteroidota bacterium]
MNKKIILPVIVLIIISTTNNLFAQLLTYNGKSYFLNGLNVPWNAYSTDFGLNSFLYGSTNKYDSTVFENIFIDCENYGVNCVRMWIHDDGSSSPEIDTVTGFVTGLDSVFFPNMDDFLNRALKHKIMVIPSLWSFSMLNNDYALGPNGGMHADIIQDTSKTNSYINNALIPIVQRYANQCNLLAWEIMNEPEWATTVSGNDPNITQHVPMSDMQRFVGMCAEAIHQNSNKMVTVGAATVKYNSDVNSFPTTCVGNFWKDAAIQAAYNKPLAYLDFYQIHYYDWMKQFWANYDPYDYSASYWGLDKPTIIGESQGSSTKHSTTDQLYNAFTGNYAGVLFWSYNASADSAGSFYQYKNELLAFRNAAPGIVDFDTTACLTTGIHQSVSSNAINIYPNPSEGKFTLEIPSGNFQLIITNIIGDEIYNSEIKTEKSNIDLGNQQNGIYLLKIKTKDTIIASKIIIQK